ncbi:unnamed protein product [Pleuronectes platessa]|uniref:Ig-like domain-containing protein n=1 Tax=Pleuronectes platessa TaxID=8262 RepID=A0A9N7Z4L4_PLEPL|nr:unnamed protein product [Pleuronectes platessa]
MLITVLYLSLLLNSGLTVNVLQSGDQVSRPGVTVILECSPGPGFTLQTIFMYWYRQKHYAAPVEFLLSEIDFSVGHFQSIINKDKNRFSLQIDEVFLNDSSRYYCVASHSDAQRPDRRHKCYAAVGVCENINTLKETVSVTLEVKPTLEKEQN